MAVALIFHFGPQYGHKTPAVYVTITGTMGSLTVMSCKGLGIALKQTMTEGPNQLVNPFTWFILCSMVTCIVVQLNYMNKALDMFNTAVVTLLLYFCFTSCVILASGILFKEWSKLSPTDVVGNVCGFSVVLCGIYLVQFYKDVTTTPQALQVSPKPDDNSLLAFT